MSQQTLDIEAILNEYVGDLNSAAASREFPAVVKKWFGDSGMLMFHHEVRGKADAKRLWTHLLPTGEVVVREVLQFPYKVENGRVYSWRQLQGGNVPRPIYNTQETQFDDRTLISEIIIRSAQEKPEVETDPAAETSRLGRIFLAFAGVFNDYFATGDDDLFDEWLADDIHMVMNNTLRGMGIMQHYARISEGSSLRLSEWEQLADNRARARVALSRGGEQYGAPETEFTFTPDGRIQELTLLLVE